MKYFRSFVVSNIAKKHEVPREALEAIFSEHTLKHMESGLIGTIKLSFDHDKTDYYTEYSISPS